MRQLNAFVAYPTSPPEIGKVLHWCKDELEEGHRVSGLHLWEQNDIAGRFISTPILEEIQNSDLLIADITVLNFNVTYEIGYAIGVGKRVFLIKNEALDYDYELIRNVGIFDTVGYATYQNSGELLQKLLDIDDVSPLFRAKSKENRSSPVYLILPRIRTDFEIRLISRVKRARLQFRSFDPDEQGRLSAREAIDQISQSYGVVIPLIASTLKDSRVHNLRAAFAAGLAHGMGKKILLIQTGDDPVPLDYRDLVKKVTRQEHIDQHVAEFATEIAECLQADIGTVIAEPRSFLANLNLGSSAAENELPDLGSYYLETEEFRRTLQGDVRIVSGRKGSGKTAIFAQVRDSIRRNKKVIVLDLKPEGFQLLKFREVVLDRLNDGAREHTVTAFWEYVLLLEICHKILEKDRIPHLNDHRIFDLYRELVDTYQQDPYVSEGDFSERMLKLTGRICDDVKAEAENFTTSGHLASEKLTELLYKHDVGRLRESLINYLRLKDGLWILFDNLDKGWPAQGLESGDIVTLKCLLESLSKLENALNKKNISANCVVFIRGDVYDILVEKTSDRGKNAHVAIDWSDADMLRELIRKRLVRSPQIDNSLSFDEIWPQVCVSHIDGEESSQYLIDRCLMRPRGLIDLLQLCKSHAVNLGHNKIQEEDIRQGEEQYSTELLTNIGFEIRDVFPDAGDVLYEFVESKSKLTLAELKIILSNGWIGFGQQEKLIEFLLWYGFLGVLRDDEVAYIYSVRFDVRRLQALIKRRDAEKPVFHINPAFRTALEIKDL